MTFTPAFLIEGSGRRTAYVLHGILANKKNWRLYCRKLAAELPQWRFVLVDTRGHGESHGAPAPHTLQACVDDLDALPFRPEVVVGHSFGGKVALAWAERHGGAAIVLDSYPGVHAAVADDSDHPVAQALRAITAVSMPAASRRDVVEALTGQGLALGIAQWLTTSLTQTDDGLAWAFDVPVVRALIEDYWSTDLWHVLEQPGVLHVRGGRSDRFADPEVRQRLDDLGGAVIPDAGHWLHVDAPDALRALLIDRMP